ncbi:hypothetical protein D039_0506A, partial [Vibrio parahaemolyticus EKP-028]
MFITLSVNLRTVKGLNLEAGSDSPKGRALTRK